MKRNLVFLCCLLIIACGQNLSIGGASSNAPVSYPCPTGNNVMTVTVDGSLCGSGRYVNEPCASITICPPGSSGSGDVNCQTINNMLVDTGSYGVRVFASVLNSGLFNAMTNVSTTTPSNSPNAAGECVQFGSGNTWGSVKQGDVYLAGEPKATLSIQLIDYTYSGGGASFGCPITSMGKVVTDETPNLSGYNGILGIGLSNNDCASCTGVGANPMYWACDGSSTCTGQGGGHGAVMPVASQVSNPVPNFSSGPDTNGLVFLTAATSSVGNQANNGCVVFGINTASGNNTPPTGTALYPANALDEFTVTIGSTGYPNSFVDSGSNAIYVDPSLPIASCNGWLCPANLTTETFTSASANSVQTASSFQIINADTLFNTANLVFNDLGGQYLPGYIDLGIPYFYGRPIYVGVSGKSSTVAIPGWSNGVNHTNTGPYWAY